MQTDIKLQYNDEKLNIQTPTKRMKKMDII